MSWNFDKFSGLMCENVPRRPMRDPRDSRGSDIPSQGDARVDVSRDGYDVTPDGFCRPARRKRRRRRSG